RNPGARAAGTVPRRASPAQSPAVVSHSVTIAAVPGTVDPLPDRPLIVTFQKAPATSSAFTEQVTATVPVGRTSDETSIDLVAGRSIAAAKQSSRAAVARSPMTTMPPSAT